MGLLTWMQLKAAKVVGNKLGGELSMAAKVTAPLTYPIPICTPVYIIFTSIYLHCNRIYTLPIVTGNHTLLYFSLLHCTISSPQEGTTTHPINHTI